MGNENGKQLAEDKKSLVHNKKRTMDIDKGKGGTSVDLEFSNIKPPEKSSEQASLSLEVSGTEKEDEKSRLEPDIRRPPRKASDEFTKDNRKLSSSGVLRQQGETSLSVYPRYKEYTDADTPVYEKSYFCHQSIHQDEEFNNKVDVLVSREQKHVHNDLTRTVSKELLQKKDESDAGVSKTTLLHERPESPVCSESMNQTDDKYPTVTFTDNGNKDISDQIRQTLEDQSQAIRTGVIYYQKSNRQILKLLTERERQAQERGKQHIARLNELELAMQSFKTRSEKKDITIAVLSDIVDKLTNQIDLLTNATESRNHVSDFGNIDLDSGPSSPVDVIPAQNEEENDEDEKGLEETTVDNTKEQREKSQSGDLHRSKEAVDDVHVERGRNDDVVKSSSSSVEAPRSTFPEHSQPQAEEKEWDANIEWTLPDPIPVKEQPVRLVLMGHWIEIANGEIANGKTFSVGNGCGPCTVLCFDVSDSMRGDPFKQMIILGLRFVKGVEKGQHAQDKEKIALVSFGHETAVLSHLSINYDSLKDRIKKLRPGGPSPLMGAIALAFGCIRGTMKPHKTIPPRVIVFTDGLTTQGTVTGGPDMFNRTDELARVLESDQECHIDQECILSQMKRDHIRIHFVPLGAAVIKPHMLSVSKKTNGKIVQPKDIDRLARQSHYAMMVSMLKEAKKKGRDFDLPSDLSNDDMDELQELMRFEPSVTLDSSDNESGSEQGDSQAANSESDPNMPPLGSRVRRGPDWNSNWDHQDSNGPGTVVSHTKKGWIWIMWDNGHRNQYPYGKNGNFGVIVVDEPRILKQNQLIETGCLVTRGPDWRDNDKDGGAGSVGAVFRKHDDGSCGVRWPNGIKRRYKFGKGGFFEVIICDPFDPEVQAAVASHGKFKVSVKDPLTDDTVNEEDTKKTQIGHVRKHVSVEEMNKRNTVRQTLDETTNRKSMEEENASRPDDKKQTVDKSVEEMNKRNTMQKTSSHSVSTNTVEEMNTRNAAEGAPSRIKRGNNDIDAARDANLRGDTDPDKKDGIRMVLSKEKIQEKSKSTIGRNDRLCDAETQKEMGANMIKQKDVSTNEKFTNQESQKNKSDEKHGASRIDVEDNESNEIRSVNENLVGGQPQVLTKDEFYMNNTQTDVQTQQDVLDVCMKSKAVKSEKERKRDNAMLATLFRPTFGGTEEEITNVFTPPPQVTRCDGEIESENKMETLSMMSHAPNINECSQWKKSPNHTSLTDSKVSVDRDSNENDCDLSLGHNSLSSSASSDEGQSHEMAMTSSYMQPVVEDFSSSLSSEASREDDADEQRDVVWQRKGENGGWVNFPPDVSAKIEKAYRRNPQTTTSFLENKKRFKVMLSTMTLVHPTTKQMTNIRRLSDYKH